MPRTVIRRGWYGLSAPARGLPVAPNPFPQLGVTTLFSFVGYGPSSPRFVFIGAEEGSDGDLLNLQIRCAQFPLGRHDRDHACQDLADGYIANNFPAMAQRYLDALVPGREPTWTFISMLLAALRNPTTEWQAEYARLGSSNGDTLLTELFPLPKPGTGAWPAPYAGAFAFPDQGHYYDAVWPRAVVPGAGLSARADLLAATVPTSGGHYVFGYGRGGRNAEFWDRFDRLFGVGGAWTTVIPRVAEIARHRNGAVVARLAHPSRNGIGAAQIPAVIAAIRALP